MKSFNKGIISSSLGSFWWGVLGTYYFQYISFIGTFEVVVHRCIWTTLILLVTTFLFGKWTIFKKILSDKKTALILFITSILIFGNWSTWIYAVASNKIIDAVLLEVKNNRNDIDEKQLSEYLDIAKEYGISKFLTISNQFVAYTTQSPTNIKPPKHVSLYHLSWTFILTIANILITDNDTNIDDVDQLELMREIVAYFESQKSGILGLTQMKPGWVELTQKANAGTKLKISDQIVEETVSSWLQEERCMALVLSKELGLFVRSGQWKYKHDLSGRFRFEQKELVNKYKLESKLHIDGAASPLKITAYFDRMTIGFSAYLSAPSDKQNRGKISWLKNQLKKCDTRNHELYTLMRPDLMIDVDIKHGKHDLRLRLDELDSSADQIGNREISGFSVLYLNSLGKKFESRKGVVEIMEKMLINFYLVILEHLKKWDKPAPQIKKTIEEDYISDLDQHNF